MWYITFLPMFIMDLAETIMNPANCHSSRVTVSVKYNSDFSSPEPVYVYTDVIKPNLVADYYVRILTTLQFPSTADNIDLTTFFINL